MGIVVDKENLRKANPELVQGVIKNFFLRLALEIALPYVKYIRKEIGNSKFVQNQIGVFPGRIGEDGFWNWDIGKQAAQFIIAGKGVRLAFGVYGRKVSFNIGKVLFRHQPFKAGSVLAYIRAANFTDFLRSNAQ